ncbi:MAG: hypothetical protein FD169_608 [Bacillota bacterium]|nr:MAG: hypothetical protein FD169_608 [Bacillota bacterium]
MTTYDINTFNYNTSNRRQGPKDSSFFTLIFTRKDDYLVIFADMKFHGTWHLLAPIRVLLVREKLFS